MALGLARRSVLRVPLRRSFSSRGYYESQYGPAYTTQRNLSGFTLTHVARYGMIASGFGVASGLLALYIFGDVPRVREDILMNVPVIGGYWERKIPPEDNPF